MSRRPYPKYKSSGVEWLGAVPEHWDVLKCKFGYSIQLGKMLQNEPQTAKDEQVPYLKALYVNWEKVKASDLPEMWASPGDIRKYSVRDGDLLVCEGGEGGRAGILQNPPAKCIIQNALHRVRPRKDNNNQFLMYLFEVVSHRGWFDILCNKSTIAHFTAEKFGWLSIALPLSDEQHAIAAFLDRETARIDALMEKKQRQIELLQEKRAALISHAVTKGLDSTVPMKASGIEWMGQIPNHWELSKLKHITSSIQTGPFGSQLHSGEYVEDGLPAINPSNLQNGTIVPDWRCCVDEEIFARLRRHRLDEGDIVFARRGEMGRCALVTREEDGWLCGTGSIRIRLNKEDAYPPFVYQVLSTPGVRDWLFLESVGSTMENLNTEIMSRIPILLPPLDEQIYIVGEIEKHLQQIDNLKTKIQASIDKLKEYRTALISAAVTGQIDVREAAA